MQKKSHTKLQQGENCLYVRFFFIEENMIKTIFQNGVVFLGFSLKPD